MQIKLFGLKNNLIIESKISSFSPNFQKPALVPFNHTIVLEYTSALIECFIYELTKKINKYLPEFKINIAYRSVKVKKLFGYTAKAKKILLKIQMSYMNFCAHVKNFIFAKQEEPSKLVLTNILKTIAQIFVPINKIAKFTRMTQKIFLKKIKNSSLTH